ncbi:MAG: dockerin type I repeat-containing protein [Clostridia bacterium]|nr:dockerin type I repeat-containing protein [Clostridia bacterium]
MKKMKKLLSVVLAVVLALSAFSVMGLAAITPVQTVDNLKALDAYSDYGQVTRLSTEERASIIQDALDALLNKMNLNMGTLFSLAGISITIDLSSVDALCKTVDGLKDTLNNTLVKIAMGVVDLGIIESVSLDTWNTGIDRAGDSQLTLFSELFELLGANKTVIANIIKTGTLNLGIINLGDMSAVTDIIGDLPGLVKGLVFPMLERWDDTLTEIKAYDTAAKGNGGVESTLNTFVKNLFKNDMSITTVKYDVNGNMTSNHTKMPIVTSAPGTPSANSMRCVYVVNGTTPGSVMTVYHIVDEAEAKTLAKTPDKVNGSPAAYTYFKEAQTYVMSQEVEGSSTYVWKATDEWGNTWSLKWYDDNSPFLPGMDFEVDLANISAGDLLYKMIPVVFENMAPVVLNGSIKKVLAELFAAKFAYVGQVGDDTVEALPDSSDPFFTQEQGEYLWEWSDYKVINGNHYYRFEDQIFAGDISNVNNYFSIINWDYEITGDFMNEFVPSSASSADTRILQNVNNFLIKVAETVLVEEALGYTDTQGITSNWTRPAFVKGDNSNLVNNIKMMAQAFIELAPMHIFGSDYATNPHCYYVMLTSDDNDTVLTGIAAQLVDIIMPSMTLPTADELIADNTKVGAILAAAVREFAAYLTPEYNYDALIYADFGTTEEDPVKSFVSGKDSDYWFDVCLTMGINAGFEYLRAFADMGEGTSTWESFVAASGYKVDGGAYTEADLKLDQTVNYWEGMVDYIVDWGLSDDFEWSWKFEKLVNTTSLNINLATIENPWQKIQTVLQDILPVDEILTVEPAEGEYKIEHWLREDLILGIVDLNWGHLINTIQFNGSKNYFRNANILDQLAPLVKGIVNSIFKKVGGGSFAFIPSAMTDFDTLANQTNIATLVENLLDALTTAYNNGVLDVVFPFINFILGWKTDPQVLAEPAIWTTFRDGNDYAFQWSGNGVYPNMDSAQTQIHFLNSSSGMLEIHRNSSVEDHEYAIQIKSVTSDATVNSLTFDYGDGYASPYETIDIKVGGKYNGQETVTVTIAYSYIGKDGSDIGGTLYTSVTFLISDLYEDAQVATSDSKLDGGITWETQIAGYNKYIFSEDIYGAIVNSTNTFKYKNSVTGNTPFKQYEAPDLSIEVDPTPDNKCNNDTYWDAVDYPSYDQYAKTKEYFTYRTRDESGWPDKIEASLGSWTGATGQFYKAVKGADYDYPIGIYAFQPVSVQYDGEAVYQQVFIHYDNYGIDEVYSANAGNGYNAHQGVDEATYNEYNAAWKDIVKLATYPMMTEANNNAAHDYVKVIMPQIEPAMERFEAAKEAYETALAEAQASGASDADIPQMILDLKAVIDDDYLVGDAEEGREINFQDVEFYEYFNYNDVKVKGEELYRTYLAPEVMDTYYILNSGIRQAELDLVIDAEPNANKAAAIEATKLVNSEDAINASILAHEEWKQPVNKELYVDDLASRIEYYEQFVKIEANREANDHLYFLEQELAHVYAQNLKEDYFESVSWYRFATALAAAEAVVDGSDPYASLNSRIYDVKYNLMTAYKQLLLKRDSLIEAGGTADLLANIEIAEGIFAMDYDELVLSDIALEKGLTVEDALGHLLQGLGYYYQAIYSENDEEVKTGEKNVGDLKYNADGSPMMFNLYADSAYEYADNDRPNKQGNQAKVDACNANLEACIDYFVLAEAEPNTLMLKEDAPFEAIIDLDNNIDGEFTGTVYGFDTLGWNDAYEVDGTIADFLTTAYGDDYLEVIEADGGETTGTIINVLDENGDVVESYVYIYFGDVNGDGLVDNGDSVYMDTYGLMFEGIDDLIQMMASDVNGDGMIDNADSVYTDTYGLMFEGMPTQYEIAEMAVCNYYEFL